jgi:DNA invertase Pin-like site-specific DNA recombinase
MHKIIKIGRTANDIVIKVQYIRYQFNYFQSRISKIELISTSLHFFKMLHKISRRRETTIAERDLVLRPHFKGKSFRDIMDVTGIPKSTVGNIINRYKKTKSIENKAGRDRNRLLKGRETRLILDI